MALTFWNCTGQWVYRTIILPMGLPASSWFDSGHAFLPKTIEVHSTLFSIHGIRKHMTLIWPVIFILIMWCRWSQESFTILKLLFLLVLMDTFIVGWHFQTAHFRFLIEISLTTLSIHLWALPKTLTMVLTKMEIFFFMLSTFVLYLLVFYCKEDVFILFYLFIYFYKHGLIEYYLMDRNLLFLFEAHFVPFGHYPANATATLSSITIAWCGLFLNLTWKELYIYIAFCVSFLLLNLAVHLCWV